MKDKLSSGRPTFGLKEAVIIALLGIIIAVAAALHYAEPSDRSAAIPSERP